MKSILKILPFALIATLLISCGDDITNVHNTYHIETVEVKLSAKSLITEAQTPFQGKSIKSIDSSYTHQLPISYEAYFVADETRGQYTQGQVVKTITVTEGMNNITIPQMKFKVYVTNYLKPNGNESQPNAWYTWSTAIDQMPQTSHTLNLLGSNSIDYAVNTVGEVEMSNPYAAVMIKDNQWISSAPSSYDTNESYFLDATTEWYILYIRNNNTNTKIPINIPGNYNQHYTLNRIIESNKIYQYTINGNVLEGDGNLNIVVLPLEVGYSETIDL